MKTGSVLDVALVLKSLFYLNLIKPLSFREKRMMERARDLLVMEISEVEASSSGDVEKKILDTLSTCFKNVQARMES
jgi:CarD family transcriptional regulator